MRAAALIALARPVRPVVTTASTRTHTPIAATIHQAGRVAAAKPVASGPCSPAARTDPVTATPSDEPTCRLVEAIPAAVPARARGMPATALLVTGALTQPIPAPSTTQHSSTYQAGEAADRKVSRTPPAVMPVPAISSGTRVPRLAMTRPHSGAEPAMSSAIGTRNPPAARALYPRTSCR